jgi:hypothetical protein
MFTKISKAVLSLVKVYSGSTILLIIFNPITKEFHNKSTISKVKKATNQKAFLDSMLKAAAQI